MRTDIWETVKGVVDMKDSIKNLIDRFMDEWMIDYIIPVMIVILLICSVVMIVAGVLSLFGVIPCTTEVDTTQHTIRLLPLIMPRL